MCGILSHNHTTLLIFPRSAARPDVPIFTVNLLVAKFYVVASPTLISGVQRNHRSLSFEYFINLSASGMLGIKGPGMNLLREEQKGGGGLGMKVTHAMNPALLGAGLDDMNAKMITFLKASVDELASARDSLDLFSWTRHVITVAATESAWGNKNPYRSRELEDAFWYAVHLFNSVNCTDCMTGPWRRTLTSFYLA